MMKSFFKKLAFVMALALVVSAMAPAATAKAADVEYPLTFCRQLEAYTTARSTDELTEGDVQDYKFAGAPGDWRTRGLVWDSTNKEVAIVDQAGLVTTKAAGTTEITVIGDGCEGKMTLTVKSKNAPKTFDAMQTTANTVVLTFADEATAKAAVASLAVTKKITTLVGTNDMPWALNDSKTKVEGNKVTIEPWVPFGTASYVITVDGFEPFPLDTAVGAPAEAVLTYAKPYYYADTENQAGAEATLVVTDAKGVKLTSGYSVYYEIVAAEPSGYAYVDGTTGKLSLYSDPTFAVVKVTVRYTDANNQQQSFERTVEVTSSRKPVVTVNNYLEATAIVSTTAVTPDADAEDADANAKAKKDKIVWGANQIKIGDGTAQVVGLIKKSDNSSYSINNWSVGTKDATKNVLGTGFLFKYTSTDTSKVIVDENDGTLVGVNTTDANRPAYVLVTMYKADSNSTTGWSEIGIVGAVPVVVEPKKAAQNTTLDKTNATLLTDGSFTTVEVTPTTWNQYGEKVTTDTIKSVKATFNNITHEITSAKNQTKFTIDAAEANRVFNTNTNVKAINLTYKVEMNSGKTADFFLTLKEVQPANVANQEYKLNVKGAEVKADKLDDEVKVGVVSKVLGEKYGNADFYYGKVDSSVAEKDDLYVVVLDQNRNVVTPATAGSLTVGEKITAAVTKNEAGAKIETLAAGVYTVELYKVTAVIDNPQGKVVLDTRLDVQTYSVTTSALPTVATDISVNLNETVKVTVDAQGNNVVTLNEGAVTFKFNGEENKGVTTGKFTIVSVDAVTVGSSDKVFVYSVKVQYKLGNGYVEFTVPVNKTFTKQASTVTQ